MRAPPESHIHLIYLQVEQRAPRVNKAILNVRRGELETAQHESQRVKTFSIRCRLASRRPPSVVAARAIPTRTTSTIAWFHWRVNSAIRFES